MQQRCPLLPFPALPADKRPSRQLHGRCAGRCAQVSAGAEGTAPLTCTATASSSSGNPSAGTHPTHPSRVVPGPPALPAPGQLRFPGIPTPQNTPSTPCQPKHIQRPNLRRLAQAWGVWVLQGPPAGAGTHRDPAGPQGFAASSSLPHSGTSSLGPGLCCTFPIRLLFFSALRVCLCISCKAPSSPSPAGFAAGRTASSGSVPRVHGDRNRQECTETPTAANPGPEDSPIPDSLPGARCGSSQLPVGPPQPRTDRQTDGRTELVLVPAVIQRAPRIPPGPFPSGAVLMSARAAAAYRPRSDSLISLRRYKSLEMPSQGEVARGGTPAIQGTASPRCAGTPKHPRWVARVGRTLPAPGRESGSPQPPRCPRHASTGSPWGTSAPRPQTDPMKTIMAPVEGNQGRRSAMRPAGLGESCPPAPGPSDPAGSRR